MKQAKKPAADRPDSERKLLQHLLVISLVLMVTTQTAVKAQSRESDAAGPSVQQNSARGDAMKSQVLQIPEGAFVEVRLTNREKLRGQLGELRDEGFVLRTVANNRLTARFVQFEELHSLRALGGAQSRDETLDKALRRSRLIMGLVIGGLAFGLLACAAAETR